ncbi:hypothetical protein, partial [Shewanella sp. DNRA4]|uniref:hypothetical protein n=1 Tax=Shewanella sp. DNRA4 TaxID=2723055 RepID=UPI001B7CEBCD
RAKPERRRNDAPMPISDVIGTPNPSHTKLRTMYIMLNDMLRKETILYGFTLKYFHFCWFCLIEDLVV